MTAEFIVHALKEFFGEYQYGVWESELLYSQHLGRKLTGFEVVEKAVRSGTEMHNCGWILTYALDTVDKRVYYYYHNLEKDWERWLVDYRNDLLLDLTQ